ncbi:MAG TPA: exo-alpha-sialidase [bacterium]|nr:exo-alpha-sialidase [bacterium]
MKSYKSFFRYILILILIFTASETYSAGSVDDQPYFGGGLIFEVTPGRPQCHASTLTQLPDGDILAAWYAGEAEKAKDVAIMQSRYSGSSGGWTAPQILNDAPGLSDGNPVLYTDPSGTVWFIYMVIYGDTWDQCKIHYKTSVDSAKTWSEEQTLIKKKGYAIRNRPITLRNGTMLLPAANEMLYTPLFVLTRNNFKTVRKTGTNLRDEGGLDQPAVVQLSDDSLLAYFRSTMVKAIIMKSTSTDGGLNWSEPEETQFPNPEAGIDMHRLQNGNLVLVFNDSPNSRHPLTVALSEDDGKTWPWKRNIETDSFEFSYPCVIQSSDGLIHVSYTWKRTNIKHVEFNESWIKLKD